MRSQTGEHPARRSRGADVTDFGLARVIGKPGSSYRGAIQGGTRGGCRPSRPNGASSPLPPTSSSLGCRRAGRSVTDPGGAIDPRSAAAVRCARRGPLVAQPVPRAVKRPARRNQWELRTIADKAAQPAPERRYQSAAELVGELERVRDRLPIEAERHVPWRRARKWNSTATPGGGRRGASRPAADLPGPDALSVWREVRSVIREKNALRGGGHPGRIGDERAEASAPPA